MAHVVLAMAYAKLDQPDKAQSELDISRGMIEEKIPNRAGKVPDLGRANTGYWHDWVMGSIFLGEAEDLLK
jgi:hypothetical protein